MTNTEIASASKIMIGSTEAIKMYIGSTQIWTLKSNPTYTAPTAKSNLLYDYVDQDLLNEGYTNDGTILYSKDNVNWDYTVPLEKNAGTYTVYWRLIGDSTHYDVPSTSMTISIDKADPIYTAPSAKSNLSYTGSQQTLYNNGTNSTAGSFSYSNGTRTNAGSLTVSWTFTPTNTSNYNSASGSFSATIAKASRGSFNIMLTNLHSVSETSILLNRIPIGEEGYSLEISSYNGSNDSSNVTYSSNNNNVDIFGSSIKGVSVGTCVVTATISESTNYSSGSCSQTVSVYDIYGIHNGHLYIEINGVNWATVNLGGVYYYDIGGYYQWGDSTGCGPVQVGSYKNFSVADYKYCDGTSINNLTKYNSSDGKVTLDSSDDAARVLWGGKWRMPTVDEYRSLIQNTENAFLTDYQGAWDGYLFVDSNDILKRLFFRAVGYAKNGTVNGMDTYVKYWTNSRGSSSPSYGFSFNGTSNSVGAGNYNTRECGMPVRAVYDPNL